MFDALGVTLQRDTGDILLDKGVRGGLADEQEVAASGLHRRPQGEAVRPGHPGRCREQAHAAPRITDEGEELVDRVADRGPPAAAKAP